MKIIILIIGFFSLLFLNILPGTIYAQSVNDYNLLPGPEIILPIGESADFKIYWSNVIGTPNFGTKTQFSNVTPPAWTLNGKLSGLPASSEGRLVRDLTFTKAAYYAPDKVPKINPVTIAVKFKANDSSKEEVTLVCNVKIVDPGQNWFFAYICSKSSKETIRSSFRDFTKTTKAIGSASMLIDASPPQDGYVIINTEQGDKVISSRVNGIYNFYQSDVEKAPNGNLQEKTLRNYAGTPVKSQGLLFEYDPSLKGFKGGIQGAGISFDVTGTDEFWKEDVNLYKLKKTINKVSEKYYDGILLGSNDENIKKIKNGFSMDFSQSKDSSYTDILEAKHTIISKEQYHAVLLWVNKELK